MRTDDAVTPATYGAYVGSPLLVNTFFPPKDQYCHLIPWGRFADSVELAEVHYYSPLSRARMSRASNRRKESHQRPAKQVPRAFSGLRPNIDSETVRIYAEREEERSRGAPIPRVLPVEFENRIAP